MFLKILLSALAGGFTVFVVMQNLIYIKLNLFRMEVSVPFVALAVCFLMVGFVVGLLWRNLPHHHSGPNQVPLIRADMKVSR